MPANTKVTSGRKVSTQQLRDWLRQQGVEDNKHNEVIGRQILQAIYDGKTGLANQLMRANPPTGKFVQPSDPTAQAISELFGLGPNEDFDDSGYEGS